MRTIKTCPKCGSSKYIGWGYIWRHKKRVHRARCSNCGYLFFDE